MGLIPALVAGPLSPLLVVEPLPATVVMVWAWATPARASSPSSSAATQLSSRPPGAVARPGRLLVCE